MEFNFYYKSKPYYYLFIKLPLITIINFNTILIDKISVKGKYKIL